MEQHCKKSILSNVSHWAFEAKPVIVVAALHSSSIFPIKVVGGYWQKQQDANDQQYCNMHYHLTHRIEGTDYYMQQHPGN